MNSELKKRSAEKTMLTRSCSSLQPKTELSFKGFLVEFSPARQMSMSFDEAVNGDYPELSVLKKNYGENAAVNFLIPQLVNLSEFCGCKEKLQGDILRETAQIISNEYFYLKVSEIISFFYRFKTGRYGRFYGSIDPMIILSSLRVFVKERNEAIIAHEDEERRTEREKAAKNAVSWEVYQKMKGENRPNPLDKLTKAN